MTESCEEVKQERRKTDYEVRIIFGLLAFIMAGLTWWMTNINAKADKVPILEEKISSLMVTVKEIQVDVKSILGRRQ